METAFWSPDFGTQRQAKKKPRTVRTSSQKRRRTVYPDLNEFLSQYPVATVNEYGEKVIYGKRICQQTKGRSVWAAYFINSHWAEKGETMKTNPISEEVYTSNGYKNRDDYLNNLADDRGIDRMAIDMIADVLGESEDFDGLVSALDDYEDCKD